MQDEEWCKERVNSLPVIESGVVADPHLENGCEFVMTLRRGEERMVLMAAWDIELDLGIRDVRVVQIIGVVGASHLLNTGNA